jgi:hypothetical protein
MRIVNSKIEKELLRLVPRRSSSSSFAEKSGG